MAPGQVQWHYYDEVDDEDEAAAETNAGPDAGPGDDSMQNTFALFGVNAESSLAAMRAIPLTSLSDLVMVSKEELRLVREKLGADSPSLHKRLQCAVQDVLQGTLECSVCASAACDAIYPCGHAFCGRCVHRWRATSTKCPTCKQLAASIVTTTPPCTSVSILEWVAALVHRMGQSVIFVCPDDPHCSLLAACMTKHMQAVGSRHTFVSLVDTSDRVQAAVDAFLDATQPTVTHVCTSFPDILHGLRLPHGTPLVLIGDDWTPANVRVVQEAFKPPVVITHSMWPCGDRASE